MKKQDVVSWLLSNGFTERKGASGHRAFYSETGARVTVLGHGGKDMTPNSRSLTFRQLEAAGYSRELLRSHFGTGKS